MSEHRNGPKRLISNTLPEPFLTPGLGADPAEYPGLNPEAMGNAVGVGLKSAMGWVISDELQGVTIARKRRHPSQLYA